MSNPAVNPSHDSSQQWDPDHVRRQVMRQARYALNVSALIEDRVPPEGPCDVALTNGLLAVIAASDPNAVIDKKGRTLPARDLLRKALALGFDLDEAVLAEVLDLTQRLRHGRADDEWIQVTSKHLEALRALDDLDGLQVLYHLDAHATVDALVVTLFYEQAWAYAVRDVSSIEGLLDVMNPEQCDECFRRTFVPLGHDNGGGTNTVGLCIACGYRRDEDKAWEMYSAEEWEMRWKHR